MSQLHQDGSKTNSIEWSKKLPSQITNHIIYCIVSGILNTIGQTSNDSKLNYEMYVMKTNMIRSKAQIKHEMSGV